MRRWTTAAIGLGALLGCGEAPPVGGGGSGSESGDSTAGSGTDPSATSGVSVDSTAGGSGGSGGSDGTAEGSTTAPPPDMGPSIDCELDTPMPESMSEHTLDHDGAERRYVRHVPSSYDHHTATPVVFAFHGYTNSPQLQEQWSMMSAKAEEAGFILVYPYGTGLPPAWNAGDCCGFSSVDDVGFVSAMIDQLEEELCIDPARVYATGFSNGGFLSHRLACELSDRIAAVGPVAGMMGIDDCMPGRPVPVLQLHGTADPIVPYDGSVILGFASVDETIAGWVDRNGCAGDPAVTYEQGDVTCVSHQDCEAGVEVELCTVEGGGHTWPGGADIPGAGPTTQDIVANDYIWEFFLDHPLP